MKVMVTGATGFIGRHLVNKLVRRGHKVVAVARDLSRARKMDWFEKVDFIVSDIHFPQSAEKLAVGCPDVLIHLAWPGLPHYKALFHFEVNLPASYRFIKEMVELGCRRVLVTGTCFEYGLKCGRLSEEEPANPVTPYALAKDSLRRFLTELQVDIPFSFQWVRLFYMHGSGQNPHSLLAQLDRAINNGDKVFNMSGGEQLRDYLPVENAADLLAALIESPGIDGVINCCSGKPISIRSLVEQRIKERESSISLNLGFYPYPDYEPMAFWGNITKLTGILNGKAGRTDRNV